MIMTRSKAWLWGLIALAGTVQTAALAKIVIDRQSLLTKGREIIIKTVPVDPRDLFRGDYVTLGYDITRISGEALGPKGDVPDGIERGGTFYAVLSLDGASNTWRITRVSARFPDDVAASEAVIKGRVRALYDLGRASPGEAAAGKTLVARYGIETYFVPEGTGKVLEDKVRSAAIKAIVALGADGTAALKGLIVDGERRDLPAIF